MLLISLVLWRSKKVLLGRPYSPVRRSLPKFLRAPKSCARFRAVYEISGLEEPSPREELTEEPPAGATASDTPHRKSASILLQSLPDPDYPYGFIIRSAGGKKTYLICREPPVQPSLTVPSANTAIPSTPPPTLDPNQYPSDSIIDFISQQLVRQHIGSSCFSK